MLKLTKLTQAMLGAALTVSASSALAAAFQLSEISTSGLGRAYAGDAAVADNASALATNPALMTQFQRPEFSLGGVYVRPDVNLEGVIGQDVNGQFVSAPKNARNNADHSDIAKGAIIPNLYYVHPVNPNVMFGAGINVNYGLATEFDDQYNAGFFAGKTDLTAINFNLSTAFRIDRHWSLGAGFNAVYADALIERHAGVGAARLNAGYTQLGKNAAITPSSTVAQLKGKEWGFGYNLGITYEFNENNRLGLAYHSPVDIDFNGDFSSDLPDLSRYPDSIKSRFPLGTDGKTIPGQLTLKLPAYWELSGWHKLTEKLALSYSYKYTQWSRFKELYAYDANGQKLFKKAENFKNASRFAVGVSYDVDPKLTLRGGLAYDQSPVQDGYYSISIPDADRTWISIGATYRFTPNLSVDAGYAHLIAKDNTFVEKEGSVAAKYSSKSTADLFGLALNYRF
ncbi:outer membrane protein transport protein [Pasteurellaceae bacterium 20609_3]|uniref:porin n=1 Tax=Spirabiliibacterium mucosae TaxID=28156 RepID=UPI001AAD6273|nr:porin [Spirabiliibacterium mucosae]MBE2898977.1 outer membrane protein transport protein [Spirabiliibacterium mucosae]